MIRPRVGRIGALVLGIVVAGAPIAVASSEGVVSATVRVHPLTVALDLSASQVVVGRIVQARATVTNSATSTVDDIGIELRLDRDGLVISKGGVRAIRQLKAGKAASVTWSVCAMAPGTYLLLAQVTTDVGTLESRARILTVAGVGRRAC